MTGVAGSGRAARSGSRQPVRLTELPLGEPGAGGRRGSARSAADAYRPVHPGMRTANIACQRRAERRLLPRLGIQASITERDRPDMRGVRIADSVSVKPPGSGTGECAPNLLNCACHPCLIGSARALCLCRTGLWTSAGQAAGSVSPSAAAMARHWLVPGGRLASADRGDVGRLGSLSTAAIIAGAGWVK